MVKKSLPITETISLLKSFVFGKAHRTPMIEHRLSQMLATKMRKDLDSALTDNCIIRWTDFSKGKESCFCCIFEISLILLLISLI